MKKQMLGCDCNLSGREIFFYRNGGDAGIRGYVSEGGNIVIFYLYYQIEYHANHIVKLRNPNGSVGKVIKTKQV